VSLGLCLGNEACNSFAAEENSWNDNDTIRRPDAGCTGLHSGLAQHVFSPLCLPRLSTLYCTVRRIFSHSSCRRSVTAPSARPTPPRWRRSLAVPRPITRSPTAPGLPRPSRPLCSPHHHHPAPGGRRRSGHRLPRPVEDTATGRGGLL
jgi:hypothetical protein